MSNREKGPLEVSDAGGKAEPAGVAGQARPELYVPGSGDRVPAELRLVLAGYLGVACGLFAVALACAAYVAVFLSFVDTVDQSGLLFTLAAGAFAIIAYATPFLIWGAVAGVQALIARIRFSRLLRRPSDPRTATVTASKRGGRTLTLDIPPTGRGYQSPSEVRLALWMKAGMLVPGETVNVWSGRKSELLIGSPQRGRAFLGTVTSQSALQRPVTSDDVRGLAADRPAVRPPDTMKVRGRLRGVWLVLWLAGAAGCIAVGVYADTPAPESTPLPGSHAWWLPLFLFLAALSVGGAMRSFGRGLDADGTGVVVGNTFRATPIPWRDLAAIEFKGVESPVTAIEGDMYYKLVFQRHDGSRVTAEAPGGGTRPGEYLFELRERLLAMRYAATWPLLDASNPTPTGTPPTTATWPLLDEDLPSWPSPISESDSKSEGEAEADGAGDPVSSHPGLVLPIVVFLGGLVVTVATILAISLPATRAERAIEQGPRVTATVSDVRQPGFYEDLLLTYSYDGQEYSIWRGCNDASPPLGVGMTVQVSLDPADPGWAASETLDPTSAFVETFIIVGSLLGPVSTVWAGILCIRRLAERFGARRTNRLVRAHAHS